MLADRRFWLVLMAALVAFYVTAIVLALEGQLGHRVVRLALIVLGVHVLELPFAFRALKDRAANPLRVVVATLVFGAFWWEPAKRGVFPAA